MNNEANPTGIPEQELPRLAYKIHEVAKVLGISTKGVRRLISRGLLKRSVAMRHILIPASEIQKFLDRTTE